MSERESMCRCPFPSKLYSVPNSNRPPTTPHTKSNTVYSGDNADELYDDEGAGLGGSKSMRGFEKLKTSIKLASPAFSKLAP